MNDLKAIIEGEYYNNADLMGIDVDNANELLGRINTLPPQKKAAAIKNLVKPASHAALTTGNSRLELESKFAQLPPEIRKELLSKRLQIVDTRFFVVKDITGKSSMDMFQGTDNKNVALGNIANSKLEKDNWFLLSAIQLQYGEGKEKELAEFGIIPPIIRNGEYELEAGNKKLIGLTDLEGFNTTGRNDIATGYYKLTNTKIIEPQVEIKMPLKFTKTVELNSFLKVTFIGSSIIPF